MEILNIGDKTVQIDIASELSDYRFDNARWAADKLIASSPFRDDRAPSFFVNLSGELAGAWGDSGALDYEYASGNFVKLIALLRGISYEESADYLIEKYGALYEIKPDEPIRLRPISLREPVRQVKTLDNPITQAVSPYLLKRGISEEVQRQAGVGYDEQYRGFTAIPWMTEGGDIATVFYRRTAGKQFFYNAEGTPKSRLVYGIDRAQERAVIVEGPIDALSWETAGMSAIAVGGASLSRDQAEIIKRSRIKRLYLGGDNDRQGAKLNEQVADEMRGYAELLTINYNEEKDANAVLVRQGVSGLRSIIREAEPLRAIHLRA